MKKIIVKIKDLRISLDNPRLDLMADYNMAVKEMVKNQQNKLYFLAKDICENGLNPQSIIAIYPSEYENNVYCVAEGNRRILSIQIIQNPDLIKDFDKILYLKFLDLHNKYSQSFNKIEVALYNNSMDLELIHWLQIIHDGENNGKGVVTWGPIQKARFNERFLNKPSALLHFQENLLRENILTQEQIVEVNKTNWERMLSKVCMDFLMIDKINNNFILPNNKEKRVESIRRLIAMVNKLRNQTVRIVYDEKAKIDLINSIREKLNIKNDNLQSFIDIDNNKSDKNIKTNITTNDDFKNNSTDNNHNEINNNYNRNGLRSKSIKKYKFENLKITQVDNSNNNNNGIFNVAKELELLCKNNYSVYDCEKYPIATLILIRSLLELSIKYWLKNKKEKLWKLITSKNKKQLLSKIIDDIIKWINNGHEVFSKEIDDLFKNHFGNNGTHRKFLNLIVHNPEYFSRNYKIDGTVYEISMLANSFTYDIIYYILNN